MLIGLLAAEVMAAGVLVACTPGQETEPPVAEYRVGADMNVSALNADGTPRNERCRIFEHGVLTMLGKGIVNYEGSGSDGSNGECPDDTTFYMPDEQVRATDTVHDARRQEITERRAGLFTDPSDIDSDVRKAQELVETGAGTPTERRDNEDIIESANPEDVGTEPGKYSRIVTCELGEKAVLLQLGDERLTGGGVLIGVVSNPTDKACKPGTVFIR